jgi:hypothetical protein
MTAAAVLILRPQWWRRLRKWRAAVVSQQRWLGEWRVVAWSKRRAATTFWFAARGREGKEEKRKWVVSWIHLYSSVKVGCTRQPSPPIFVGEATSPMNIGTYIHWWHGATDEYIGLVKVKLDDLYMNQFLAQTNKYNFIFIDFGTDEYNLNIFVGTDELKKTMNEWCFPVVLIICNALNLFGSNNSC